MISQRALWVVVLGMATAVTAVTAQTNTALRWRPGAAAPLGLQVQVAPSEESTAWRLARSQTAGVSVIGRSGFAPDVGLYGRFGTTSVRPMGGFTSTEAGTTYGVGLSWEFSRNA